MPSKAGAFGGSLAIHLIPSWPEAAGNSPRLHPGGFSTGSKAGNLAFAAKATRSHIVADSIPASTSPGGGRGGPAELEAAVDAGTWEGNADELEVDVDPEGAATWEGIPDELEADVDPVGAGKEDEADGDDLAVGCVLGFFASGADPTPSPSSPWSARVSAALASSSKP